MATGVRFTKPKRSSQRWQLTVIVDVAAIATKISFRTAVDSSACIFCESSHRDRSNIFFIIESRASRTLRYPQHMRDVNVLVLIACRRATTSIKHARANEPGAVGMVCQA